VADLGEALHLLAHPILLVGAHGGLVFANRRAERLLADGTAGAPAGGRRATEGLLGRPGIARAIDAALRRAPATASQVLIERADGPPLVALVAPLPPGHRRRAAAMIVFGGPDDGPRNGAAMARRLFGLTGAEATVLAGLAAGRSIKELAGTRDVAVSTVVQQVKSLLRKTGMSRQSDLVRLVHSMPPVADEAGD
jgi:DNA-binding CsgD family transcriptional regulator